MDMKQAFATSMASADMICDAYLGDLTPAEMLKRPCPGINHVSWQLGHLIASDAYLVGQALPGKKFTLPDGFAERHTKETSTSDNAAGFLSKDEYLKVRKDVRGQITAAVQGLSAEDFDKPVTGKVPPFLKTVGDTLLFIGDHWIMHAGQWAVLRRTLGRKPLF